MRNISVLTLLSVAESVFGLSGRGPFLERINATHWVFGNDIWNVTQGPVYATNLQYQGSDAVRSATGHYAGVDGESNLRYTSAAIVSDSSTHIDISFSSTSGDLHWVMFPELAGAYQYFVNKALPDLSIFRTLWRLDPDRFTKGYTTSKNEDLPEWALYKNAPEVQDETFLINGRYISKYDFANYVRERDFVGVYGNRSGSWYIHPSYDYFSGDHLSQTLTVHRESATGDAVQLNVVQDTSHFRVGAKTSQSAGKIWGPWLWYLNDGSVADVQKQAAKERASWPYSWLNDTAYQSRGSLAGKLTLSNGRPASGAAVFLGDANTSIRPLVQGSNYYYTTYADSDGNFSFKSVRSGDYGLYAWSNGKALADVYTNYTTSGIVIAPNRATDLGVLTWPIPKGRQQIFQIGDFDKKATGFQNGGVPNQHGSTEKGPANLTFTVGKSRTSDWYYASSKLGTWNIVFETTRPSPNARALLSVSLAGYSQSNVLTILLNGNNTIATLDKNSIASDPALYRSGTTSGEWRFFQYEIDGTALMGGKNVLSFRVDRYTQWRGFLWDSIILEWIL
ncbi:hypothetical protein ACN47E_000400 [Coniothyrium glycines]